MLKAQKFLSALCAGVLSATIGVGSVYATAPGIPTVDGGAIAQAILTLNQLKQEYDQMVRLYDNNVKQFNAISGIRNISSLFNHGVFVEFMPDNLKTSIRSLGQYGEKAMTPEVRSLYNKFGMGNACMSTTGQLRETCLAKAAVDATRLYANISASEVSRKAYEELQEQSKKSAEQADDLKGGAELIAANQRYQANLEIMKKDYEHNMKVLDEQARMIQAKEDEILKERFLGKRIYQE